MPRLVALIFLTKTWIYFNFEVCHHRNQALVPQSLLKSLPLAPARPEDTFGIQVGRDSTAGKDFNKDLGTGLDPLTIHVYLARETFSISPVCSMQTAVHILIIH